MARGKKKEISETENTEEVVDSDDNYIDKAFEAIDQIENSFSNTTSAFKYKATETEVISTSSPAIDDITIVGGFPRGRITHIFGPFGSGKTFLCMIAAKAALAEDPKNIVFWLDAENTFEYKWATALGIWDPKLYDEATGKNRNRLKVIKENDGVAIFERLSGKIRVSKVGPAKVAKKVVPGYIDLIIEGKVKCPLIVLDSLAAMIPPGEDTSPVGKVNISLLARFLPIEFRRLATPLYKSGTCLMCINQVVTNIGDSWGDEFGFSGGEKLKHWISLNLYVEKVGAKEGKILTEKDNVNSIIGQKVKVVVKKNKFGPYPRSCQTKLLTVPGTDYTGKVYDKIGVVDVEEEWIDLAISYGILSQGGAGWFTLSNGERVHGKDKLADLLRENKILLESIKSQITEVKKKGAVSNLHIEDEDDIVEKLNKDLKDNDEEEVEE